MFYLETVFCELCITIYFLVALVFRLVWLISCSLFLNLIEVCQIGFWDVKTLKTMLGCNVASSLLEIHYHYTSHKSKSRIGDRVLSQLQHISLFPVRTPCLPIPPAYPIVRKNRVEQGCRIVGEKDLAKIGFMNVLFIIGLPLALKGWIINWTCEILIWICIISFSL